MITSSSSTKKLLKTAFSINSYKFYEFPEDSKCWELQDQYMFGSDYLVAPIFHLNQFEREVYLPAGKWEDTRDHKVYNGGQTITADAPLDSMPVFKRI